jgi:hypothetical protein
MIAAERDLKGRIGDLDVGRVIGASQTLGKVGPPSRIGFGMIHVEAVTEAA